jgi:hypothetical protein
VGVAVGGIAVGTAVGGTTVGAGVATGAQAESNTLTSINPKTSNLRVFIFSPLAQKWNGFSFHLHPSIPPHHKYDISCQIENFSVKCLNLLFHTYRMKIVNHKEQHAH